MNRKKGYIRTIEAMIAIMIALFFLTYMTHQKPISPANGKLDLSALSSDENFHDCAISGNYTCLNELVYSAIPKTYDFAINDSQLYYPNINKEIYAESFLLSGTVDEFKPVIIRVFYWKK